MTAQPQDDRSAVDAAPQGARRGRGRPRVDIDLAVVAEAAVQVFAEGGYEAVSIENISLKLDVSRATLYRTVPTKDALLGILFERSTADLFAAARAVTDEELDAARALRGLIHVHVDAAVRLGAYMTVFSGGAGLAPDVYARWREWTHTYESLWVATVGRAMAAGVLPKDDPMTTTRLILGMLIWVSRWHGASESQTSSEIADSAVRLVMRRTRRAT